ncbi:hypothetical protein AGDE_13025 [Angomonas deanei]|uniref:Uncharacterized protein n=1 Tax=Angomonas deanei TaxID=59799 RepID=A0A7G2C9K9_9TRYP|nr:hypothetical protein AGDE_13025 [Angomonas deanei]CAD2215684.1 hypothetical protein, conserved [Angomonas deanei]|eukprot:EPY22855.1 hypothetical protein AGDE_13025 [Angomonas deanei]
MTTVRQYSALEEAHAFDVEAYTTSSSDNDDDNESLDDKPFVKINTPMVTAHNPQLKKAPVKRSKLDKTVKLNDVMAEAEMLNAAQAVRDQQRRQELMQAEEELRPLRQAKWQGVKERMTARNSDRGSVPSYRVDEFGTVVYDEDEVEDYRFRKSLRHDPDIDHTREENHYLYTVMPSARNDDAAPSDNYTEDDQSALLAMETGGDARPWRNS